MNERVRVVAGVVTESTRRNMPLAFSQNKTNNASSTVAPYKRIPLLSLLLQFSLSTVAWKATNAISKSQSQNAIIDRNEPRIHHLRVQASAPWSWPSC